MPRSVPYHDILIEDLKDHKIAVAYLKEAYVESLKNDEESKKLFQLALKNVIEAYGGIENLAKKSPLPKEILNQSLSPKMNAAFVNFGIILGAMGIKLEIA